MKNSLKIIIVFIILFTSCTDAQFSKRVANYGNSFKIEMYSGGVIVRSWISTGKVATEAQSDGYFFKDAATGKLVEVSGDIVITNVD